MNFTPIAALFLFPVMLIFLELGRRFHIKGKNRIESTVVEGAVFAIFGLLLAFTFAGAVTRYDAHRQLLIEETNDIDTAYLRLDLLPAASQPALRQLFREYTASRFHLFDTVAPEISPETARLQRTIWHQAVAASAAPGASADAAKLLLPSLNAMIDITMTRRSAFNMHPPAIVFLLLFAFSCGCAYIAGYSMAASARNWFYILALALTVTLTVYSTLEIEYPRRGLIRLTPTDKTLIDLRNSMN